MQKKREFADSEQRKQRDTGLAPDVGRRLVAALAIGLFGTLMAFAAGAHAGATLDGRVMSLSVAQMPTPQATLHAR